MKKIDITLNERLLLLKKIEEQHISSIQNSTRHINDSLKPINIIKYSINDLNTNNSTESTIGVLTGFLTKKVVVGNSKNIFRQLFGSIIQSIVTKAVFPNKEKNEEEED